MGEGKGQMIFEWKGGWWNGEGVCVSLTCPQSNTEEVVFTGIICWGEGGMMKTIRKLSKLVNYV
jgi:hypothetical protein